MLCIWWNFQGVLYFELLNHKETITAELFSQQSDRLQAALVKKRPVLINRKGALLLHDNARPHVAKITAGRISELNWEVLPHPPYSPDLAPSDYLLFRSFQNYLDGRKLANVEAIKTAIETYIASKPDKFFK